MLLNNTYYSEIRIFKTLKQKHNRTALLMRGKCGLIIWQCAGLQLIDLIFTITALTKRLSHKPLAILAIVLASSGAITMRSAQRRSYWKLIQNLKGGFPDCDTLSHLQL